MALDRYRLQKDVIGLNYCSRLNWQDPYRPKYSVDTLREAPLSQEVQDAVLFWGHHASKKGGMTKRCLSQWWQSGFVCEGERYSCAEQYMMAAKASLFEDWSVRDCILACDDPRSMKELGRRVAGFDCEMWDRFKYAIVRDANWYKFSQNPEIKDYLLSTEGRLLVEASPYDRIWGIGLSAGDDGANNVSAWRGENLLGFALMEVRDKLLGRES